MRLEGKALWSDNTEEFLSHFEGLQIFVSMGETNSVPWHYHAEYEDVIDKLQDDNNNSRAVFFTVNELDKTRDPGRKRTAKMCFRCRALFLDDDIPRDEPRDDFPLTPSLIVRSSEKKYHYYWLTSTDALEEWRSVQSGIVVRFEGDKNAKDLSRYLRLPGYKHLKKGEFVSVWQGSGIVYDWKILKDYFPPQESAPKGNLHPNNLSQQSKSKGDSVQEIRTGKNYHENLISLSYQMKQEGVPDEYAVLALQGFMNNVDLGMRDERWQSRYDDIERYVEGAVQKEIELPDIPEYAEKEVGEIPWPPGLLGKLADDAYAMARFQYKEVALISALGLIAGIVGRKFNVSNTGLNVYLTLIMQTGMGKDSISEFIHNTLMSLNEFGNASSFKGDQRFTGPRAVYKSLSAARSQVCVFTEAGLLLKSKSGDREGLARVLLSLYGKSGHGQWSGSESFSKDEDRIDSLHSPCLTIINEATPETLLEAFSDNGSLERGDLPRQSIYRIHGDKPYPNMFPQQEIGIEHFERLKYLSAMCSKIQSVDEYKCYPMIPSDDIKEDMQKFAHRLVDLENEFRSSEPIKSIMASRMWLKAAKFSALASVYNHTSAVIHRDEWEWAKRMVEFELSGLQNFFAGSAFDGDIVERIVIPKIVKLLKGEYKTKALSVAKRDRKRGMFPRMALNQLIKNNPQVKAQDRGPYKGYNIVIDDMIKSGLLLQVSEGAQKLKITEIFELMLKDL